MNNIGSVKASQIFISGIGVDTGSISDKIENLASGRRLLGVDTECTEYELIIENDLGKNYKFVDNMRYVVVRRFSKFSMNSSPEVIYSSKIVIEAANGVKYNVPNIKNLSNVEVIASEGAEAKLDLGEQASLDIKRNDVKDFKLTVSAKSNLCIGYYDTDNNDKWLDLSILSKTKTLFISAVEYSPASKLFYRPHITRLYGRQHKRLGIGKGVVVLNTNIELNQCIELMGHVEGERRVIVNGFRGLQYSKHGVPKAISIGGEVRNILATDEFREDMINSISGDYGNNVIELL